MIKIISECNDFLKDCALTYAFCGGYAIELFLNKKLRSHSDVDITVFEEDKNNIINFMLNNGWNIYEHKADWDFIEHKKTNNYLRAILDSNDEKIPQLRTVWAIKPDCSFFKIETRPGKDNTFDYEILNKQEKVILCITFGLPPAWRVVSCFASLNWLKPLIRYGRTMFAHTICLLICHYDL